MADIANFIGAGLRDAKIVTSDGDTIDLYAIVSAEGSTETEETEVRGDDTLLGTFNSSIREELTLQANGVSFAAVQALTGNDVDSSATGSEVALGTDSELNTPFVEIQAFTTAKTKDGEAAVIKKTWHKVQLNTITVTQQGEQEFQVNIEATALQTETDIQGGALDSKRISTLNAYEGTIA